MSQRIARHIRQNVVAYVALFFAMGGTAYAAATIGSEQIIDDSIRSADVRNETSTGGGLTGADIRNATLSGADLAVTTRAGRQASGVGCGYSSGYNDCVRVNVHLRRPQRLFLTASGEWSAAAGTGSATIRGECLMEVDNNGTHLGKRSFGHGSTSGFGPFNYSTNDVTGILPRGNHFVDVSCREAVGDNLVVTNTVLSVAAVGDG